MLIRRRSPFTGVIREIDLPITQKQLEDWLDGTLAQYAFPNLTAGQREFLLTGVTSEEWDKAFGKTEEVPGVDFNKLSTFGNEEKDLDD